MIKNINLLDLLFCLTNTCDLIDNALTYHHKRVAYMAFRIAEKFGLTKDQQKEVFIAGLLHDIGAFSTEERLELIAYEPENMNEHSFIGAGILENFKPLKSIANIIRYHHLPWDNEKGRNYLGMNVPLSSHIVHLADRIVVLIDDEQQIIGQINNICQKIEHESNNIFMPVLVDSFLDISHKEFIWLDTTYKPLMDVIPSYLNFETVELNIDEIIDLSKVFANIIDFRSPFTANHSYGVAAVAEKLAYLSGFSENECKMMLIAGYLHDLGKLTIDKEILEKPDKLNASEFNAIRSHTFYTFRTLQAIKGFETINIWASYHHERLSGNGYPFHISAQDIPLGSRLMALADVFTAIKEDRPYRKGMERGKVLSTIESLVANNSICSYAFSLLKKNFDLLDSVRLEAQKIAKDKYNYVNSYKI